MAGKSAPGLRREFAQAIEEPVDLRLAAQEDAAQRETAHPARMMLGIGQCEGGAPGAAEHEPAIDAEMRAQLLHVLDQMRRRIVLDLAQWLGPAAAALVENHDAVEGRVEKPAVGGIGAGARTSVEKHDRHTLGVAALLIIHAVGCR
jgi:hypothetical protein